MMAKQMSDTKKEFVQKYMLDEYSRAIPTKALAGTGRGASLGEYCEPIDSKNLYKKKPGEDDINSDSDNGYADPQDAVNVKKPLSRNPSKEEEGDVYELAQQAVSDYDVPPPVTKSQGRQRSSSPRKPSPKPRGSQVRRVSQDVTPPSLQNDHGKNGPPKNTRNSSPNVLQGPEVPVQSEFHDLEIQPERRRPGKKVVEIEYEVASAIRPGKAELSASRVAASPKTKNPLSKSNSSADSSVSVSSSLHHSASAGSRHPGHSSSPAHRKPHHPGRPDMQFSMSQPAPQPPKGAAEGVYEEPWDLKVKRLKQEQEEKMSKKLLKQAAVEQKLVNQPDTSIPVYEQAWDSAAQQRKLEERLNFARSLSTSSQTSETDIFHDALEAVPAQKGEPGTVQGLPPTTDSAGVLKPLPMDTYEDAWDLKNSVLDQQIRKMQIHASATYEEPWDRSKQQEQLQAKFQKVTPQNQKRAPQRSSSEVQEPTSEGADSKSSLVRGKFHSVDENKVKSKSKGCNIGQRINPMIPLVNQNWFHGNISRDDAEKMLCVCKEGSYIVRISSDRKSYSLSIKSSKQYIHVQIEELNMSDGTVRYILGKNSKEFPSIPEMIDHYTHHRVPLKGAEHITLLHPVECKWS
ncbi:uncharacterized protein LOC101858879 isoform X2 [Aplysia californica]|uniref:Uncharacterized protein LOC101858879 isoform X2 n=1 Tax=Aplysia californica TaxID=6500 RepID=A0ABM0JZ25_APLCA|nr:uncharacterized protein LOC101858879 isoform X2 [Aplysia californica]